MKLFPKRPGPLTKAESEIADMNWPSVQHVLYCMPHRSAEAINAWRKAHGLKPLPNRYKWSKKDADAIRGGQSE